MICPGSHASPKTITRHAVDPLGRPSRGICQQCLREYNINDVGGVIRKHYLRGS
jgi:hypothetical protein